MADLLFEVGVEELPAKAVDQALSWMKETCAQSLIKLGLDFESVWAEGTPRRLVLIVRGLPQKQEDRMEEITGPKAEVAFDAFGKLTKAGEGFVLSKGLPLSEVFRKATPKGEVIAIQKLQKGAKVSELLPPLLMELLHKVPFEKKMRWEPSRALFARPVRWLLGLLDGAPLSMHFADVQSGSISFGHRFLAPEAFTVQNVDHYLAELKKRYVMLDRSVRKRMIEEESNRLAIFVQGQIGVDEELLEVQKNLVEYPWPVMGSFESSYLEIPSEILISEMRNHQKYSSVVDSSKNLLPYFVTVAGTKPLDRDFVARGNARVLRARFEDGAFYFEEDTKKTLADHARELSKVVFERDLGTMAEKVQRIEKNALALAELLSLSAEEKSKLKVAASLCKADLVCGVVKEFPELQGVIGRTYASLEHLDPSVCMAIEQHYWPRFAKDRLPESRIASILACADRLDTLVGIMGIDKGPKGSADPFGLRRAAIAICRIVLHEGMRISLGQMVELALRHYGPKLALKKPIREQCVDFMVGRIKGLLLEELSFGDSEEAYTAMVEGVLSSGHEDLVDVWARALALKETRALDAKLFEQMTQTFKRAQNIVHKARENKEFSANAPWDVSLLQLPVEKTLWEMVQKTEKSFNAPTAHQASLSTLRTHYLSVFAQVVSLKPHLDAFFDQVMVMCEDRALRNARLGLLQHIENVSLKVADFKRFS